MVLSKVCSNHRLIYTLVGHPRQWFPGSTKWAQPGIVPIFKRSKPLLCLVCPSFQLSVHKKWRRRTFLICCCLVFPVFSFQTVLCFLQTLVWFFYLLLLLNEQSVLFSKNNSWRGNVEHCFRSQITATCKQPVVMDGLIPPPFWCLPSIF